MKRFGKMAVGLAGGLAFAAGLRADVSSLANNLPSDNPYALVSGRNIFGLNPPPPPPDPTVQAEKELPKITPEGLMDYFGHTRVLYKVSGGPSKPGQPAKDQFYNLSEGQGQDDIEVVRINEKAGLVTFKNHGFEQELPLASPTASGSHGPGPGPAPAGMPASGMAGGIGPSGGNPGAGNPGGFTTIGGSGRPRGRNAFAGNSGGNPGGNPGGGVNTGGGMNFFGPAAQHSNMGPAADLPPNIAGKSNYRHRSEPNPDPATGRGRLHAAASAHAAHAVGRQSLWRHAPGRSVGALTGPVQLFLRGGFNQLPELRTFLERLVLAGGEAGTEQEILQRVPAQDAVDQHAEFVPLEIDAVIAHAEAVQRAPGLLQLAELFQFRADHLLRQPAKIAEDLELQFLGHPPQLGGGGGRENDLKHRWLRVES